MATDFGFEPVETDDFYFVSYNSEDADRAGSICRQLYAGGVPLWYDRGLHYGEKWEEEIALKMKQCKAVILFFTKGILEKEYSYVRLEYELAERKNKKIYVVFIDDVRESDITESKELWWIRIRQKQAIEKQYSVSQYCREIMKALNIKTEEEKREEPKEPDAEIQHIPEAPRYATDPLMNRFCPVCGKQINISAAFCVNCGARIGTPKAVTKIPIVSPNQPNVSGDFPAKRKIKKKTHLILCIALGYYGAHKFYEGKIGLGFLYLFTCGLFLAGWIIDIINIAGRDEDYYN